MINRRFLRIKVLQAVYAYKQSEQSNVADAQRKLMNSIDALYELFVRQMSLLVEVKQFAEQRIEENRHKNFPTEEDLNPNLKFVSNRVINAIENNKSFERLEEKYKINWAQDRDDFVRRCYNNIREYPEYEEYMNRTKSSFEEDKKLLLDIIDNHLPDDDNLFDFFSDGNLFFNSDYQLALFLLWKFINELTAKFDENSPIPPAFKTSQYDDEDDKHFVAKLFEKTLLRAEEYRVLVSDNISNWDYDRIALMDKLLIFMALTEFTEFHEIPVKVTINEYIELSKNYSTSESRRFINGLLDKLVVRLKEQNKLVKTGLGLVDN